MHRITITAKGIRVAAALAVAACASLVYGTAEAAFSTPWVADQPSWNPPHVGSNQGQAAPVLADVNGDNLLDALIGANDGNVYVFFNQGSSTAPIWPASPSLTVPAFSPSTTGGYSNPAVGDLNGDGLPDLLIGNRNPSPAAVLAFVNTGTASAPVWTRNSAWDVTGVSGLGGTFYAPALADLNGDGKLDLVLGGGNGAMLGFVNTGTTSAPVWTRMPAWDLPNMTGSQSTPELADLDGDGDYDLMMGGLYGTVFAFRNVGTVTSPQWQAMGSWFVPDPDIANPNIATPALGDLNGDGNIDLLYGDVNGNTTAYRNTGLPLTEPGTSPPAPPPGIHTEDDTFDTFTCSGAWTADPAGPNSSYTRNCDNGWVAYALDSANTAVAPPWSSGPVGDQNAVTLDNVNGPSATNPSSPPLGAAEMFTAPTDSVRGELWLMKTFPVIPGQPIDTLAADYRLKVSGTSNEWVGMIVFDGAVARPPSDAAYSQGLPQSPNVKVLASSMAFEQCGANTWCPWHSASIGGQAVVPTHATITVAFKISDIRTNQTAFADVDNVKVSGVVTPAQANVPVGDIAQLWNSTYTAPGADNGAKPAAVAVDGSGNVYVAGSTYGNGSNYDIVVIKYDASGNPVWGATPPTYDGGDADEATGISVDSSGNVYVTGRSFQGGSNDIVSLKYNSSGVQQWAKVYDNAGKNDQPVAQALDGAGNLYVTGWSCDAGSTSTGCDYVTLKYNSAGTSQWPGGAIYDDAAHGTDQAVGIGLDGSGNVYVTGTSANPSSPGVDSIATVKYNASGVQQWVVRTDTTGSDDHAVAIAVDNAGDSYVTGWNYRGTGTGTPSIVTVKYDTTGSKLWQKDYDDGHVDMPVAMALDSSGNVYVTGKTGDVTNYNIITLKYLASGADGWVRTYGNANRNDLPVSVAVDGSGNVYMAGILARSAGNTDFVTVRYDSSGTAKNAITYDGYNVNDVPVAMALGVDGQGDTIPVVTGISADGSGVNHMETVRYEKARPDLTISHVSGPTNGTVGSTIDVDNTVLNIDDLAAKKHADSGPFDVALYVAPDVGGAPDFPNMTLLGTRSVSNLTPGQSSAATTTVTIPSGVAEGTYFLVAVADPSNVVTEADETNNRLASSATIGIQGIKPDLAISSVSAPASVTHGTPFNVTATATNIVSTGTTTSFRVGIYASSDTNITTADTFLGSFTVSGGLAGFASATQTVSVTVTTAGTYYIGAIADDTNVVNEANETNNAGVNLSGTPSSTRLVTNADFVPGLSDPSTLNVAVVGTGTSARVVLSKTVVWTANPAWNSPDIGSYSKPAVGDLNGDGLPDLLIGDNTGVIYAYQNTGTASSPAWTAAPLAWNISSPCDTYASPVLVDLDGDGDLDLLIGTRNGVCAYQNTGSKSSPVWQRQSSWDITGLATNRFWDPAVADLNGDGKVDVILGWTSGITAYQNTGTTSSPAWTAAPAAWTQGITVSAGERVSPTMADLDGDGRPDLMLGTLAGAVRGYQNTGNLSGPLWAANTAWDIPDPAYSSSTDAAGPALADLDGDGDQDLLYGDVDGIVHAFQNTGIYSTSPGTYYSKVVDAGSHGGYTTLSYTSSVPANTTLTVDVRAGDTTSAGDSTWTGWVNGVADGGDISTLNNTGIHQYVQYRAHLQTTDNTATSSLFSIQAGTLPPAPQQTVVSVVSGSGGGGALGIFDLVAMSALAGLGTRLRNRRRPRR